MCTVTVITPVYNRPQFLEEAVLSIQNQTFSNWEHIIIDDGSTNAKTSEILEKIATYPKIKIFRTENNGLGAARNFGIAQASGEYILTLDDDDKFEPDFLKLAVNVLDTDDKIGIVGSWVQEFGYSKHKKKLCGSDGKSFLINSNTPACSLFRKKCWTEVGGYDETKYFMGYADWDFWLKITSLKWLCHIIPEYFFLYRVHKAGAMHDDDQKNKHILLQKLISNHKNVYIENIEYFFVKKHEQNDFVMRDIRNTYDYRIGKLLLAPIRKIVGVFR